MTDHTDNNHEIEDLFKRGASEEPPPEVQARLRGRLAEFREKMDHAEAARKESWVAGLFQRRAPMRMQLAYATVAALFIAGFVFVLNPWEKGPGLAFADVVKNVKALGTLSYDMTVELEDGSRHKSHALWRRPMSAKITERFTFRSSPFSSRACGAVRAIYRISNTMT